MKIGKHFRWAILTATVAVGVISILFLALNNPVSAAFSNAHAVMVLYRVETEIMQKTPAGQYYESLFWKHNDEMMRIMRTYPERRENLFRIMRLFIPELEALLDGNGDKAYITSEHVESLKSELDWFASVGSPEFSADIQKEQQRLPLDALVGMTMSQALDFINASWSPEPIAEKKLVPDSDGQWAYFVYEGVYLEYPIQYSAQVSESEKGYVYFMPTTGMPGEWHPFVMKVKIWAVPPNEKTDVHAWYSQENILWEMPIQTAEFQGFEFMQGRIGSQNMSLHAFLFNPKIKLAVDVWLFINEPLPQNEATDYFQLINQRYEYFQHMVDNIKIYTP